MFSIFDLTKKMYHSIVIILDALIILCSFTRFMKYECLMSNLLTIFCVKSKIIFFKMYFWGGYCVEHLKTNISVLL